MAKLNSDYLSYHPLSSNIDAKYMRDCIDMPFPVDSPVLICGDFHLPSIDWSIDNYALCSESTSDGVFLELYYTRGLHHFVSMPMRLDNELDLVFYNDYNCVFKPRTTEPFSISNHN
jgi:hypothetical protein